MKYNKIIIWDSEFTSWDWAMKRGWSWKEEFREVIQIWATIINTKTFEEEWYFLEFIKPRINNTLSPFIIDLTQITQKQINEKWVDLIDGVQKLIKWWKWLPMYSFWGDEIVLAENFWLYKEIFPMWNRFYDVRNLFEDYNINAESFTSWTIHTALWIESTFIEHDALWDARNIANTLKYLNKKKV